MPGPSTRETVASMTRDKYTPREISTMLGISTQAVYQHLANLEMLPARKGA
jgi:hypothetical protein